ncbi:MAG TPA: glucokinase [Gammaproteobacteria bacterium]|nr:glucokinase [Gammaproteobacteria bacterium]
MPQAEAMSAAQAPFLAADVGGTHARIGLVRAAAGGRVTVLAYRKYACADFPGLGEILRDFIDREAGVPVADCALACAGYALNGTVINTNLPWIVSIPKLRADLALDRLSLINDFEAVAYAARFVERGKTVLLAGPEIAEGPILVVGPGTGLGSAVYIPGYGRATVLATEAGQINLAPVTALERELLARLAVDDGYVSYEHILSGPGLQTLYGALGGIRGQLPVLSSPEEITAAALDGGDPLAVEALDAFCALLGSFTGNLAMLYSARGGVYLTGGILPRMRSFLERSRFVERFLDKGRMRAFLERVPVRLMEHGQLGVLGAAGWYLDNRDESSADNGGGRR